ncbi:TolC family protein, partial [Francisellaceae bacterium]|nr:TolC family protein [Francisellaceae bacterium]
MLNILYLSWNKRILLAFLVFQVMFIAIITVPYSIYAREFNQSITLSNAIELTLNKNPELKVYQFRDKSLNGEVQTAGLNPGYVLGANIDSLGGSNAETNPANPNFGITLSSVIELGGKRDARVQTVNARRSKLQVLRQTTALDLMAEVMRRYIAILAAQERIKVAIQAQGIAQDTLDAVKKRVTSGISPMADMKRAMARLSQAKLSVIKETQQLKYLRSALSILWGDKTPNFTYVAGNLYQLDPEVTFQSLYDQAKNSPDIALFAADSRLREAELQLIETQSTPDVDWTVGLSQYTALDYPVLVAGVSVPLFTNQRNKGAIETAVAAGEITTVTQESALLNLHTQLYHAYQNRKQAVLTIRALQDEIIPLLKESLKQTRSYY